MKRFVLFLFGIFICSGVMAQTVSIDWKVDNNTYSQSTCEYGSDLNVPAAPYKKGHTFHGWDSALYTPIKYIESIGNVNIGTGYTFKDNIKVVFKARWPVLGTYLFGTNDSWRPQNLTPSGGKLMGENFSFSPAIQVNEDTDVEMQFYERNAYAKINGQLIYETNSTGEPDKPVILFSVLESPYAYTPTNIRMRIYFFRMYQNDVLVRDYIPVINSSGIPCLYDKIEKVFECNSEFIVGM